MGTIRKTCKVFMSNFYRHRQCSNDSWSVRANVLTRLRCTSSSSMGTLNVTCQNKHSKAISETPTDVQTHSHRQCPTTWNLPANCHGSPVWNKACIYSYMKGVVVSLQANVIDRPFSTTSFCFSNTPKNADKTQLLSDAAEKAPNLKELKENVMTVPNLLTVSRMVLSPGIGYLVLSESYALACGIFVFVGITDVLDGWIARTYPSQASAAGSFLDPLADKLLVTILFLSLTMVDLIPLPLTVLILARDFLLIAAAFYIRYITLPPPRSFSKYFNATTASAQLKPTFVSKANTAIQLSLVALSLGAPVFGYVDHIALQCLWYLTAGTTFASGLTYVFAKNTFETLSKEKDKSGV